MRLTRFFQRPKTSPLCPAKMVARLTWLLLRPLLPATAHEVYPPSGRKNVNSRLDQVKDWPAVATKAGFKIGSIAKQKNISVRNLRRFIRGRFGKSPKRWIDELRAAHAAAQLAEGQSAKATTIAVKYAHESSFCRFFKRVTGSTTRNHLAEAWMSEKANESPKKLNNGRIS